MNDSCPKCDAPFGGLEKILSPSMCSRCWKLKKESEKNSPARTHNTELNIINTEPIHSRLSCGISGLICGIAFSIVSLLTGLLSDIITNDKVNYIPKRLLLIVTICGLFGFVGGFIFKKKLRLTSSNEK